MSRPLLKRILYLALIPLLSIFHLIKIEALVKPAYSTENIQGYVYQQPVERGDGWSTASLTDYPINLSLIVEMMDKTVNKDFGDIHGIVLIKDGKLVLEEYFSGIDPRDGTRKDYDWDVLHYTASCTKSVTSALTGIAFDHGFLTDKNEKLPHLFPEYSDIDWTDGRQNIILEHLLTMRAGLYWNENPADPNNSHDPMNRSADPIKYVLQLPLVNEPGTTWLYNSGLPILLGGIIKKRTGSYAHHFAEDHLFGPLGIQDYFWYVYPNGYPHTGGGLMLRPRDMAKIGQLYLQDGMWKGNQVISENWIEESIEPYTRLRYSSSNDVGGYGFLWWLRTINSNDQKYESYLALGYGGQYILVFEQLNMVVVFTANTHNSPGPMELLKDYILPAMSSSKDQFTRIYEGEHVNDGGLSWGVCWADYDNDEYLDLFVTNFYENNCLYHNNADGTFTKVTDVIIALEGGIRNVSSSSSSTWGDYDNDGDLDVYVANAVEHATPDNFFYLNNGDGTFTKVTEGAIIDSSGNSISTSWVDYDNDGDLDVFVANHQTFPPSDAKANYLFRNDNGEFTRLVNSEIGLDEDGGDNASWADFDNDGDLDLFVPRYMQYNALFENNVSEGLGFAKVTNGIVVIEGNDVYSIGSSWGDYDNDGDLDLFVANATANNYLYENTGNGNFTKVTDQDIVTDGGECAGSAWGDYDNDGDLDIFLTRGSYFTPETNLLYENDGSGNFTRFTEGVIATDRNSSLGAAWGDYDRDGDLDLFVTNVLNLNENNALYRNNGNGNNWFNIKCIGTVSNYSAIGAKVRLKATINNKSMWQLREISGQTGKCAQNSMNVHFGLGDATMIDSIKIEWPSGLVEVLTGIEVNQFLTITEGEATGVNHHNPYDPTQKKFTLMQNYPNPFNPTTTIRYSINKSNLVTLKIFNLAGQEVITLVNDYQTVGEHHIKWNAEGLPGGIYFYRLQVGNHSETKKLILQK